MSNSSIYENSWIDLVFEDRNQEYGAYQLRQESTKNSVNALFIGLLLAASLSAIPVIANYYNPENPVVITPDLPPATIVHLNTLAKPQAQKQAVEVKQTKTAKATPKNDHFIITQATQATPIIDNTKKDNSDAKPTGVGPGTPGTDPKGPAVVAVVPVIPVPGVPVGPVPVDGLDTKPQFPGGISKFYTFVGNNFEKPDLESGQILKVNVAFVIEKDGSMSDIKVLKDPGYGLGAEAIRVLKSIKLKWTPGIINNQAVRTAYTLPIAIQID
jgi:periplasmic protein TonB